MITDVEKERDGKSTCIQCREVVQCQMFFVIASNIRSFKSEIMARESIHPKSSASVSIFSTLLKNPHSYTPESHPDLPLVPHEQNSKISH